ncbi:hypothetical protein HDA32_005625 [Spinactinospora alkalitolerans]|uniref:Uncharacterized protein n=1 Tax=Spinactinospora alkalitolerans TaxID=687207 RepID=A0A852U4P9_9ACTN|nr:hypothetical protein [Spinactinospora alkalitolerans]
MEIGEMLDGNSDDHVRCERVDSASSLSESGFHGLALRGFRAFGPSRDAG